MYIPSVVFWKRTKFLGHLDHANLTNVGNHSQAEMLGEAQEA